MYIINCFVAKNSIQYRKIIEHFMRAAEALTISSNNIMKCYTNTLRTTNNGVRFLDICTNNQIKWYTPRNYNIFGAHRKKLSRSFYNGCILIINSFLIVGFVMFVRRNHKYLWCIWKIRLSDHGRTIFFFLGRRVGGSLIKEKNWKDTEILLFQIPLGWYIRRIVLLAYF